MKKYLLNEVVIEILKDSRIKNNVLYLPDVILDRKIYEDVDKILRAMGAKWDKSKKGHVFEYDIYEQLKNAIKNKEIIDWKKSTDFFYTPSILVNEMLGLVNQYKADRFSVLEPSAGQGHILDLVKENFPNASINCVEINPFHCNKLEEKGYSPICDDFLNVEPFPVDLVIMNPPFTYEIEHIYHAFDFLKVGGQLITITSNMILNKNSKKNKEFKKWFDENWGYDYPIENLDYSFKESGTNVRVKMLLMEKYEELYG